MKGTTVRQTSCYKVLGKSSAGPRRSGGNVSVSVPVCFRRGRGRKTHIGADMKLAPTSGASSTGRKMSGRVDYVVHLSVGTEGSMASGRAEGFQWTRVIAKNSIRSDYGCKNTYVNRYVLGGKKGERLAGGRSLGTYPK